MSGRSRVAMVAALAALLWAAPGRTERGEILFSTLPLQARLDQSISCDFQATPLTDVVQFFRNNLKINMVIDPAAADQAERLVTLSLKEIPAQQALTWALKQAGLQYVFADGAVFISDRRRAIEVEPQYRASYDVNDLLEPLAGGSSAANRSGSATTSGATSSGTTGNAGNSGDDLLRFIVIFTGPENWDQVMVLGSSGNTGLQSESREDRF